VIGSGATAVTLVPTMARETEHITMLQRSPSYVFSVPGYDKISAVLRRVLPDRWVYGMARRRNLFLQRLIYKLSKRWPDQMRSLLLSSVKKHVGKDFDMGHFSPHYKPWDERLCAVPDGDLFKAREGKASIVTDHIDTFTENGIRLKSGKELQADIIVTVMGLQLQSLGGMKLRVDGTVPAVKELMTYKGVLLQDVPNMAWLFGRQRAVDQSRDMAALHLPTAQSHGSRGSPCRDRPRAGWRDAGRNHHGCAPVGLRAVAKRCCRARAAGCRGVCCTTRRRTARCCSRIRSRIRRWSFSVPARLAAR
jgi:cation diffusion facilitator CzcD-associated flavoprotein CzcO